MRIVQLRRMTWSWRSRRHLSNGQKKPAIGGLFMRGMHQAFLAFQISRTFA